MQHTGNMHATHMQTGMQKRILHMCKHVCSMCAACMQHACDMQCKIPYNMHTCMDHAFSIVQHTFNMHIQHICSMLQHTCSMLQHTCSMHSTYGPHTCSMHVTYMQHVCSILAACMRHTCSMYAAYRQHACNISLSVHASQIHVTCKPDSCDMQARFM